VEGGFCPESNQLEEGGGVGPGDAADYTKEVVKKTPIWGVTSCGKVLR